jgi:predicted alpha/beta-fold hydrolase
MNDILPFVPALGLESPHVQTCWGPFCRRRPEIEYREEKLPLPDGDHVWLYQAGPRLVDGNPCVLLFHGLGGSRCSHYMQGFQAVLTEAGIASIAMDARGAGGRPNEKAYCYHAGSTETIAALVQQVRKENPASPLFAVGFSLGGVQLLNWLIQSQSRELMAASAVSSPLWLKVSADKLDDNSLPSRRYRRYLLKGLLEDLEHKRQYLLATNPIESEPLVMLEPFGNIHTFFEFDEYINAPLHHFAGANDYYEKCSPGGRLQEIRTPTLLLQAEDDPFMQRSMQPASGMLGCVEIETSPHGGHVGFVAGSIVRPVYWLEPRLLAWLHAYLDGRGFM